MFTKHPLEGCLTLSVCGASVAQVVDHGGSAEDGAALIFTQLEKMIKQVDECGRSDDVLRCSTSNLHSRPVPSSQELLGLEGADVDSKDSGLEEGREEDSGDVLWDLHDEQEQIEAYQQACSSTAAQLGFQRVGGRGGCGGGSLKVLDFSL